MTTTPDFRTELARLVDLYYALGGNWSPHGYTDTWNDALASACTALATSPPEAPTVMEALAARPLLEQVARLGDCIGANTVGEIMAISSRAAAWLAANPPGQPVAIEPRSCPTPGACSCVEPATPPPEQKSSIDELIAGCKPLDPEMAEALTTEARWRLFGEDGSATLPPEPPTDEEIMGLMPQQMHEDLATAVRAMAEQEGIDSTPAKGIMRIILNRHIVDLARVVLERWGDAYPTR